MRHLRGARGRAGPQPRHERQAWGLFCSEAAAGLGGRLRAAWAPGESQQARRAPRPAPRRSRPGPWTPAPSRHPAHGARVPHPRGGPTPGTHPRCPEAHPERKRSEEQSLPRHRSVIASPAALATGRALATGLALATGRALAIGWALATGRRGPHAPRGLRSGSAGGCPLGSCSGSPPRWDLAPAPGSR